ncbi:MAG TPA: ABC transporter substrate-binding protein [Methylomirabilota bacterium]|nr:ABC transporter substrate-binding protein [Methylomirabilota bacterium]
MTLRPLVAAVVLVVCGAAPAAAGAPTDRLRAFFERANGVILAPESDGGLEDRVTTIRGLVNGVFDFDGAAALALGRHWEPLSPSERAAFTRLYADVVERAYLAWIGSKARVGEHGVTIQWLDETIEGDAASVRSALLTRTGAEFPIEYRMVRRGASWLVRDVLVDGLSLAANYHVQFSRVLQMGSYDELVARLRERAGPVARAQAGAITAGAIRAMVAAPAPPGPPLVEAAAPPVAAAPPSAPGAAGKIVAEIRQPLAGAVAVDAAPSAIPAAPPPVIRPPAPAPEPVVREPLVAKAEIVTAPVRVEAAAPRMVAAAAPPAPSAPPRGYWVQVGAFRNTDAATRLVQRLSPRRPVTIAMTGDRREPLARVLVGPFAERTAALTTVRELQASGLKAFIADTLD